MNFSLFGIYNDHSYCVGSNKNYIDFQKNNNQHSILQPDLNDELKSKPIENASKLFFQNSQKVCSHNFKLIFKEKISILFKPNDNISSDYIYDKKIIQAKASTRYRKKLFSEKEHRLRQLNYEEEYHQNLQSVKDSLKILIKKLVEILFENSQNDDQIAFKDNLRSMGLAFSSEYFHELYIMKEQQNFLSSIIEKKDEELKSFNRHESETNNFQELFAASYLPIVTAEDVDRFDNAAD
jgi:hypothetical protein